jgi:bifunctional non-homologous end joining protein LigD
VTGVLDILSGKETELLVKERFPDWLDPMLATLVDEPFSDADWIYERKLDGERCLAYVDDRIRLMSRNGTDITNTYPELAEALEDANTPPCVLDGEIVAFSGDTTSFQRLQGRMQIKDPEEARKSKIAVHFYLFDVLHIEGASVRDLPLRSRKRILRSAIEFDDSVRFTAHRNEKGEEFYEEACRSGWEGLIAKDATASYEGTR